MRHSFPKIAASVCLGFALGLTAGCTFTVHTDPASADFPSKEVPPLPAGVKVDVANGYSGPSMFAMNGNLQADLQQFTETAAVVLRRELANKGAVVGAGSERKIVLRVLSPMWSQGFGFVRGLVSLEAQIGSTTINAEGEARGADAGRDFSAAITRAVAALMAKPEFQAALTQR